MRRPGAGRGRGGGREVRRGSAVTRAVDGVFAFARVAEFEILFFLFFVIAFLLFKDLKLVGFISGGLRLRPAASARTAVASGMEMKPPAARTILVLNEARRRSKELVHPSPLPPLFATASNAA